MTSFPSPLTLDNCLFCYTSPTGELLRDSLVKRFDYWDLALQPLAVRQDMGRMAAGLLIASPVNLGHVEDTSEIPDCAIVEVARIKKIAEELLVRHIGQIDNWNGASNGGDNHGKDAGRSQDHYHKHVVPKLGGEHGGGIVAGFIAQNAQRNIPK